MKTIYITLLLALLCGTLMYRVDRLIAENKTLKANQEVLLKDYKTALADVTKYKVSDSLNAATVGILELSLNEYKKARTEDYALIAKLRNAKDKVTSISSTLTTTTDTIYIPTYIKADSLRCFNYESTWTDISGCLDLKTDSLDIQFINRESLKVVETTTYKRFLGFLWKTNKVKSQQVNILSENPATQIIQAELINIEN